MLVKTKDYLKKIKKDSNELESPGTPSTKDLGVHKLLNAKNSYGELKIPRGAQKFLIEMAEKDAGIKNILNNLGLSLAEATIAVDEPKPLNEPSAKKTSESAKKSLNTEKVSSDLKASRRSTRKPGKKRNVIIVRKLKKLDKNHRFDDADESNEPNEPSEPSETDSIDNLKSFFVNSSKFSIAMLIFSAAMCQNTMAENFVGENDFVNDGMRPPSSVFLGFGFGGANLTAGSADFGVYDTASSEIKQGKVDYNSKFGFLGLMEAGYVVGNNLILELDVGMKKHSPVNERSLNQSFFNLTTFFANAQAKLTLAKDAVFRPYVGFGAALDYDKLDFSPRTTKVDDVKLNYDSSGTANKGVVGTSDDPHISLVGSAGFVINSGSDFLFDVGYIGKYSITNAEFKFGQSFVNLSPVSHSVVAKIRMYT